MSHNGAPGFAKGERSAPFGCSEAKPQTPQICEVRCANEHIKGRSPGAPIFGNERSEFPNIYRICEKTFASIANLAINAKKVSPTLPCCEIEGIYHYLALLFVLNLIFSYHNRLSCRTSG